MKYISEVQRHNRGVEISFFRFLIVGASGLVVNGLCLWVFVEVGGLHYLLSAVLATQCSTLWNFVFTEIWVFGERDPGRSLLGRLARFYLMNNAALLLRGPLLALTVSVLGAHYLLGNLISLFLIAIIRYLLSSKWIWTPSRRLDGTSAYLYDIHGIVAVESEVRLPELEYFMVPDLSRRPDLRLFNYPKPLTISAHTLRAVRNARLQFWERLILQFQSRLHSRSGRKVAFWLTRSGMPAATINAIVQILVPPPKYHIDRLIPDVRITEGARLTHIIEIARGQECQSVVELDQMVDSLLQNAEDAYGFPPYPEIRHALSHWQGEDLHSLEHSTFTISHRVPCRCRCSSRRYPGDHIGVEHLGIVDHQRIETDAQIETAVAPAGD